MSHSKKIRVAVAQFAVGADIDANLASCLRMLDEAAICCPDIVVLPEFCNHLSWYNDKGHSWEVSAELEGAFLAAISAKAKSCGFYVVVNATVRRTADTATGTSILYSPSGEMLATNDKQILIGHENDFLERSCTEGPITETSLGRIGMYSCMDGVINETPRSLSLRGGQLLCNSLNSFASDEGSLHIPVRAAENKVFIAAANKVGPLVPPEMVEPISQATGIPVRFLNGAGESQIVAPDGTVLAIASLDKEEVVYADIDLSDADNKTRADGTNIFENRRPELYQDLSKDPATQTMDAFSGSDSAQAAVIQTASVGEAAIDEAINAINALSDHVQIASLPALFCVSDCLNDLETANARSNAAIDAIAGTCGGGLLVATSLVMQVSGGYQHQAVLIGEDGIVLTQGQVHPSTRFSWSTLSDDIATYDAPFGRVALVTTDDSIYPEHFRRLALASVEVAAVPLMPLATWELKTGLLERSAENRINLLVASADENLGASFITSLQKDFTVMTAWENRPFDGLLSQPIWTQMAADQPTLEATIYPAPAVNKVVSQRTDLLHGRPWQLVDALTKQ